VNGGAAGALARRNYCHQVQNGVNGVVCEAPQPITRNLAGGVGHKVNNPRLGQPQMGYGDSSITNHCAGC